MQGAEKGKILLQYQKVEIEKTLMKQLSIGACWAGLGGILQEDRFQSS
jgi:hypothetical protein